MRKQISTLLGLTMAMCMAVSGCSSQPAATSTEAPAETTKAPETTAAEEALTQARGEESGAGTYNISVPPMVHIGGIPILMHDYPVNKIDGQIDIWTHRTATWSLNDLPMVMALSTDTMAVNMEGKRFTDESGLAMMDPWKAGSEFYSIWSDARIKVVTGIRRCGKSYLLFKLYYQYLLDCGVEASRILTIPLDDDDYEDLRDSKKLSAYIKQRVTDEGVWYVFLDEVQMCRGI